MAERKIFNFESHIDSKLTLEKFGYSPEDLGKSSSKFVVARCRYCGDFMDIRKGFFNKSGSACHKNCRLKEMSESGSPFLSDEVREKARQTNFDKWGNEIPQKSEAVKEKIRLAKKEPLFQENFKNTMIERHGVDNPCKLEDHMEKVRKTSLEKYGVAHFNLDPSVQEKRKLTSIKKYGTENPAQSLSVSSKIKETWRNIVQEECGKYSMHNFVRNSTDLWRMIEHGKSLGEIADQFGLDRMALNKALLSPDVREKYKNLYSYPKNQKQKEVFSFINSLGIQEAIMNDKEAIGLELDIYIPSLGIAIEFNGSYWHSEAIIDRKIARNKHYNKSKMCEDKGIRLIHIFEKQWEERRVQIESFLRSACGANTIKIGARECDFDHSDQNDFIEKTHIQGRPIGTDFWVNLVHDGSIVGSMTIGGHHRKSISNEAILSRMVFANNITIAGGASKMLKRAMEWCKEKGINKITTWSDSMISMGNSYEKMGFLLEKTYRPDYFYWDVKNDCYRSKQSQKKKSTKCPEGMTEREWCWDRGLYRIWDCGKKKWSVHF